MMTRPIGAGDRVVCVRAGSTNLGGVPELAEGARYVVAWAGVVRPLGAFNKVGYSAGLAVVHLEEVTSRVCRITHDGRSWTELMPVAVIEDLNGEGTAGFAADRFRPIDERDTDISELRALLACAPRALEEA